MIVAAGILLITPDNEALFLLRSAKGDHAGEFCFPGGKLEAGESTEDAAQRETREEIGKLPTGELKLLTRQISQPPITTSSQPQNLLVSSVMRGDSGAVGYDSSPPPPQSPSVSPPGGAIGEAVDFTTYILRVKAQFVPKLDDEHSGYVWASIDKPPMPLHPGCLIALDRLRMDELGVAEAIREGRLTSPQRHENVTLFALRITGTGVSYRSKDDEFVFRNKDLYLNERFLRRCNGLPVIWVHPAKNLLTSKEFAERVIGTIMLPYIQGDEVWGIARIYDDDAIELMKSEKLSTSPAVAFRGLNQNRKITFDTGENLLIENDPTLLDHLAVVERGVWDKGQEPAGVSNQGDAQVTEEEKKAAAAKADAEAKAKADADAGTKIDKLLSGIDGLSKRFDTYDAKMDAMTTRMDAFEKKEEPEDKKDAEEDDKKKEGEDEKEENPFAKKKDSKSKKDAADGEEDEDEKKKKAAAAASDKAKADKKKADEEEDDRLAKEKADSETSSRIAALETKHTALEKQLVTSDAEAAALAVAQEKADGVAQALGERAPRPLAGETSLAYRRRYANKIKVHSKTWEPVNLAAFADEAAFNVAETQIYADAMSAATHPKDLPAGTLRTVPRRDVTGRMITSFYGEPRTWMAAFGASSKMRLAGIRTKHN